MVDDLRRLVPNQIRRSYAAKFGIVLLVIGVSVGLIGSAATVQITDEVQNNVDGDFESFAAQEANAMHQWVQQNKQSTRLVSENGALRSNEKPEIGAYLTRQRNSLEGVFHVHLVDFDANVFESTSVSVESDEIIQNPDKSLSDRPWADQLEQVQSRDASIVGMSDVYHVRGEPVVAFFSRVGTNSDRVIVVTYRTSSAATDFQGANRTEGGFTYGVNPTQGVIGFADQGGNVTLEHYSDPNVLSTAREVRETGESQVTSVSANEVMDQDHVVAIAPVKGTDWVILTHATQEEAYGFVSTVSQFGLLATIAGVLLITVLGAVLGRNTASAIDRLTAKTQRMEEGDLSVDFETDRIDNIGRLYQAFGSMRDALREQIEDAQQARQEAEQARERAEVMNQHLVEKADEYSEVMREVGDGDLTRRMDPESRNEAMEEIAVEFNEMIEEIEQTTETVKAFATEVATSSEEVTASSEEVKSASEQVTESIQEISDGADRQNEQLQQVSEEMSGLSTTIEEIAASANQVAELSQRTAETGDDARENAEDAIDEMEAVQDEADATVAAMERLQAQMNEIEEITEFITDVAEQTNILALNANIEAARAGEAGEGFAVVAEEVKSLAEETRQAAEEIDQLVEDVQDQTEETATEVQQTSDEVAQSVEIVEETVDSLEEIAGYAAETNTGIQEISEATTDQASSTNQVVGMVDEAASISEQTSRESENVAAAAEQQTTALTEVTNSASDLAEQASRLSSALERFDTEAEAGESLREGDDADDEEATDEDAVDDVDLDELGENVVNEVLAEGAGVEDATDEVPEGLGEDIVSDVLSDADDAEDDDPDAGVDAEDAADGDDPTTVTGEPAVGGNESADIADPDAGADQDGNAETDAESGDSHAEDADPTADEPDPAGQDAMGALTDIETEVEVPDELVERAGVEAVDDGETGETAFEGDAEAADGDEGATPDQADDDDAIDEWIDAQADAAEDVPGDVTDGED